MDSISRILDLSSFSRTADGGGCCRPALLVSLNLFNSAPLLDIAFYQAGVSCALWNMGGQNVDSLLTNAWAVGTGDLAILTSSWFAENLRSGLRWHRLHAWRASMPQANHGGMAAHQPPPLNSCRSNSSPVTPLVGRLEGEDSAGHPAFLCSACWSAYVQDGANTMWTSVTHYLTSFSCLFSCHLGSPWHLSAWDHSPSLLTQGRRREGRQRQELPRHLAALLPGANLALWRSPCGARRQRHHVLCYGQAMEDSLLLQLTIVCSGVLCGRLGGWDGHGRVDGAGDLISAIAAHGTSAGGGAFGRPSTADMSGVDLGRRKASPPSRC